MMMDYKVILMREPSLMCRVESDKRYMGKPIMIVTEVWDYKMKFVWGYSLVMDYKVILMREPSLMCRVESDKMYMGKLIMIVTEVWDYKMIEMQV